MKTTLYLVLLTLGISCCAIAQETGIPSPDFKYQIMFVKKDSTLSNLDKTGLSRVQKDKMMPGMIKAVSGYKFYIKAEGCCANVSVSGKPTEQFIVKIDVDTDPSDVVQLYRFDRKRDSRMLLASKVTIGSASNDNTSQLSGIPLSFRKIKEGVYLITHERELEDGEYVFITSAGSAMSTSALQKAQYEKGYCFSVHESKQAID